MRTYRVGDRVLVRLATEDRAGTVAEAHLPTAAGGRRCYVVDIDGAALPRQLALGEHLRPLPAEAADPCHVVTSAP